MHDQITSWINNGCDYGEGLSLFEKYGTGGFLLRTLKNGETSTNRQKLNQVLTALRDEAPAAPSVTPVPVRPVAPDPLPKDFSGGPLTVANIAKGICDLLKPKPEPAVLQVIRERDATGAEIRALHPLLYNMTEGPELHALARQLVQLSKKHATLWMRYNYLTESPGAAEAEAPPPPVPVMIDLNLLEAKEKIRKSLNRAENRIKGQAKPKANTLALIAEQKQALADINAKIKSIKEGVKS